MCKFAVTKKHVMMKSFRRFIQFFICGVFFLSCFLVVLQFYTKKGENQYTKGEILNIFYSSSLVESADFYVVNRDKSPYVERIYIDSILPLMMYSDYSTIRTVNEIVKGTPAQKIIEPFFENIRQLYLEKIKLEIEENSELMKTVLRNEVLPFMEIELDSLFTDDITRILKCYSGGFLDYKKIGIAILGRDNKKFKEIWEREFDETRYKDIIYKYFNNYLLRVNDSYDKYTRSLLNKNIGNSLRYDDSKYFTIEYTNQQDSIVSEYISLIRKNMLNETLKDFAYDLVPMALGAGITTICPPAGLIIASYGSIGLSTADLGYNLIKNEPTPEDLFISPSVHLCVEYVKQNYINQLVTDIDTQINKRSHQISNEISKLL